MKTTLRFAGITFLCATILSACGGGGDNSTPAAAPSTPPDTRNGTYQLYATSGQQYQMAIDFDKSTYTITGTGENVSGTLKSDDSTSTSYTFQGSTLTGTVNNAHVRYTNDLLVGGFNFGSGVVPFVAGRKFATDASTISGKFNIMGVQVPAAGTAQSRIYAASISGSTMKICNNEGIFDIDLCPGSTVLSYALTVNNGVFTATSSSETVNFQAALTGSTWVYLRATQSTTGGPVFRIGLPNADGIVNATFAGTSNANETLSITTSAAAGVQSYNSTITAGNGTTSTNSGTVTSHFANGPSGIAFTSYLTSSGSVTLFGMTSSNLGVFVGADTGLLSGYMVIGTH
jgi:hypothetical protein